MDRAANIMLEPGWRSGTHQVNGLSLHVVEAGPADGPLVILLHGFPEFWWAWRRQITPLAQRGFHVAAPDMRGYGLSDAPPDVAAYRLDTLVDDVLALADSFGADRFQLVGHDWGGVIAWQVAGLHSERLSRVVIMNAPHPDLWAKQALKHPTQALRSVYVALFQPPHLPEAALSAFGHAGLRKMMARSARPDAFKPGDLDRYAEAWARPGSLTGALNYYRALRLRKAPAAPSRIKAPLLLLWGLDDGFLEPHQARAAIALCDRGKWTVVESATHWLHLEEPDRVNAEIIAFLEREPSDAR
jgi:pimeloyl-ACP methyl ester carboxylesterase